MAAASVADSIDFHWTRKRVPFERTFYLLFLFEKILSSIFNKFAFKMESFTVHI